MSGSEYCYNCSTNTTKDQEICLKCGVNLDKVTISESDINKDIYCRHCGSEVNNNAVYCMTCGKKPLNGVNFCQNCGYKTSENQEICINCGVLLQDETKTEEIVDHELNLDGISEYYKEEFKKIKNSDGSYKGKWNWAAFFLGVLWAFYKGMWQLGIIIFIIAFITSWSYIIPFLIWIFLGLRGNYLYYRFKEHGEVLPDFNNLF